MLPTYSLAKYLRPPPIGNKEVIFIPRDHKSHIRATGNVVALTSDRFGVATYGLCKLKQAIQTF